MKAQLGTAEDALACWLCGHRGKLTLHHKDGNPRNNAKRNLVLLCYRCQADVHWGNPIRLRRRAVSKLRWKAATRWKSFGSWKRARDGFSQLNNR